MKNLLFGSLFSGALALGITATAGAGELDARAIVEQANTAWNQALNGGNAKALSELYREDAILSPGNGQTLVGRAAIATLFQGFVDNGVHNHQLEIIQTGSSGSLIYQVAKWSANGAAAADGKVPSFGGITTSVLEKSSDGKWQVRSHVWNVAN